MSAHAARDLRRSGAARLREAGVASPDRDADELLAHAAGVPLGRLVLLDEVPAAVWG